MSLDESLLNQIREKGFTRQAVLLESDASDLYVRALMNARWESKVREVLGNEIYTRINEHFLALLADQWQRLKKTSMGKKGGLEFIDQLIALELLQQAEFQPKPYDTTPLLVTIDRRFDIESLRQAAKIWEDLARLVAETNNVVYGEVKTLTSRNQNLLYQIYKDEPRYKGSSKEYYRWLLSSQVGWVKRRKKQYLAATDGQKRKIEFFGLRECLKGMQDAIQGLKYDDGLQYTHIRKVDGQASEMIARVEEVLKDPSKFKNNYSAWEKNNKAIRRQAIMEFGTSILEDSIKDEVGMLFETGPLSHDDVAFMDAHYDVSEQMEKWQASGSQDHLELLLKFPLNVRKEFLEMRYNFRVRDVNSLIVGAQQLLAGGPITNPKASRVSALQNHNRFPNLQYSAETLKRLEGLLSEIQPLFQQLPDISDLATSHKLLRKPELVYTMRELPKDPLDVTFGNDSGCCIFVPESKDKMQNGEFVAHYLTHPNIRLFGVYRVDGDKEQRMGLVVTFDTTRRETLNERILTSNSLELSRLGLAGGNATIRAISQYVEDWLAGYAQQHGYAGATMGNHAYNTSVNYSTRRGDIVAEPLVMRGITNPFYSDIFNWIKRNRAMVTRDNSCYWLWIK